MPVNLTISIKDFNDFKNACDYFGIEVNNNQLNLFNKYYKTLLIWNEKINLISRKEENILEKHFLDSILFLPEIEGLANQIPTMFDIGSGGGFPAIPIAIMKPDWQFTLCESIKKKVGFVEHLIKELGLKNVEIINARVENVKVIHELPQQHDFVTARAVAKLDILIKYALPLLKKGSYLLAYKAKDIDEEIKNAKKLIEKNRLDLQIFSKEVNGVERKLVTLRAL